VFLSKRVSIGLRVQNKCSGKFPIISVFDFLSVFSLFIGNVMGCLWANISYVFFASSVNSPCFNQSKGSITSESPLSLGLWFELYSITLTSAGAL
jgi:hypothetical protein